jgi:chromosome segregation ATPase
MIHYYEGGAAMGITKEEVFRAADALAGQGLTITQQAVRDRLGGTGSFSTLGPHLRAWHEARAAARREAKAPVPTEVEAAWARTQDLLWTAALAEARRTVLADHEEQTAALRAELAEAHAEVARLETEGQRREEERAAAVARADAERAVALEFRTELGAARERAASAEARLVEESRRREIAEASLATAREDAAELRGMLKQLTGEKK